MGKQLSEELDEIYNVRACNDQNGKNVLASILHCQIITLLHVILCGQPGDRLVEKCLGRLGVVSVRHALRGMSQE